jgi:hypothetical protein
LLIYFYNTFCKNTIKYEFSVIERTMMKFKYCIPKLFKVNLEDMFNCACCAGDVAGGALSCKAGPEAGGGGCASGAAAAKRCLVGAAAGSACGDGACFG